MKPLRVTSPCVAGVSACVREFTRRASGGQYGPGPCCAGRSRMTLDHLVRGGDAGRFIRKENGRRSICDRSLLVACGRSTVSSHLVSLIAGALAGSSTTVVTESGVIRRVTGSPFLPFASATKEAGMTLILVYPAFCRSCWMCCRIEGPFIPDAGWPFSPVLLEDEDWLDCATADKARQAARLAKVATFWNIR